MLEARLATLDDVPALVRSRARFMEHLGWNAAAGAETAAWLTPLEARLRAGIPAGTVVAAVVADEHGEVVAVGMATITDQLPSPQSPAGRLGYVSSMFTEPAHRGRGFGRAVLQLLVDALRMRGIMRIELHAVDADAERLYRREGFVDRPGGIPLRFDPPSTGERG